MQKRRSKMNPLIYYKNQKVSRLIMKNMSQNTDSLAYQRNLPIFVPAEGCKRQNTVNFVRMTSTTLSQRLISIKEHMKKN